MSTRALIVGLIILMTGDALSLYQTLAQILNMPGISTMAYLLVMPPVETGWFMFYAFKIALLTKSFFPLENSENLLALRAPTTTRCDLCLVSFCGIGVQDRCIALPILSQHPHNLSTLPDLIQSSDVYECFDGNTVEVDIMLEYLESQRLTPRHIYREVGFCHSCTVKRTSKGNNADYTRSSETTARFSEADRARTI